MMMGLVCFLAALLSCSTFVLSAPPTQYTDSSKYPPEIQRIIKAATADGIDLVALPFAAAAFAGIASVQKPIKINNTVKAERIDVHGAWTERFCRHGDASGLKGYFSTCHPGMVWKFDPSSSRDPRPSPTMERSKPSGLYGRQW